MKMKTVTVNLPEDVVEWANGKAKENAKERLNARPNFSEVFKELAMEEMKKEGALPKAA